MKVTGTGSSGTVSAGGAKRPTASGFAPLTVDSTSETAPAAPAAPAAALGSVDALLALQGAPDATERRRRAVRRAGRLLDVLDEVKLALLEGRSGAAALDRLRGAVRETRDAVDDASLSGLLDEIETRAAVELAKQEMARAAA